MKKIICLLLCLTMLWICTVCSADSGSLSDADRAALDHLSNELEKSADHLMRKGENSEDIYTTLEWRSLADTFPAKFDLRERGTITPVKDQNPWGTCWSFAAIAASETSILNSLGFTAEEYQKEYGTELDLSEKHLAWFAAHALPEDDEYPDGEYPFDEAQAGEGFHILDSVDKNPLNMGGPFSLSNSTLASGVGVLYEEFAPYVNSEGLEEKSGDWSLPEEERFSVSYELKNANILPAPATYNEDGNYVYRSAATEALKTELMAGRAAVIAFLSDDSEPEPTIEELREAFANELNELNTGTEEEKARFIDVKTGYIDAASLSVEELRDLIKMSLRLLEMDEDTYDLGSFDRDQLAAIIMSPYFGEPYETIVEEAEEDEKTFMSFLGEDHSVWAQYTDESLRLNHAVAVVGWDDTFPAESWPEGHRPPGDGVWIVKNSWGTDWGMDGYFLLSYYDKTICDIGTFEYVVSEDLEQMDHLVILQHDYMPSEITSSTLFDTPVYAANIFTVEEDSVLQFVSAKTGDLNTAVTASIYLLDDDAVLPTDGRLLDSVTESFRFAGYHRMELSGNLLLPAGCRISVVILERVPGDDGVRYALVNNSSIGKAGAEAFNEIHTEEERSLDRYAKGVVNPGESFISFGTDRWIDWADAVTAFANNGSNVYMAYDNLPIKAYTYPREQVEMIHDLSHRIPTAGGEAAICPEDGYMLLDVAR